MFTTMKIIFCFLFLLLPIIIFPFEKKLDEANKYFMQGQEAPHDSEKSTFLNKALSIYLELEEQNDNWQTTHAIAHCYFHLKDYPRAILYYNKTLKFLPRNKKIKKQLHSVMQKADIKKNPPSPFPFLYLFSKAELLYTILFLTLLTMLSLFFKSFIKREFIICLFSILCITLLIYITSQYLTPLNGILTKPAVLYSQPKEQPLMNETPIKAGTKLEVIKIAEQKKWIKVISNGTPGYVLKETIQIY